MSTFYTNAANGLARVAEDGSFGDTGTWQSDYRVPQCRNAFQNTGPTFLSTIPDRINRTHKTDQ